MTKPHHTTQYNTIRHNAIQNKQHYPLPTVRNTANTIPTVQTTANTIQYNTIQHNAIQKQTKRPNTNSEHHCAYNTISYIRA